MFRSQIILIAFLLAGIPMQAQKMVIQDDSFSKESMAPYLQYLEDEDKSLEIDEIINGKLDDQFSPDIAIIQRELISDSRFWVKTEIENQAKSNHIYYIQLEDPSIYDVRIYYYDEHDNLVNQVSGIGIRPSERNINGHYTSFGIDIHSGESIKLYISAEAKNFISLPFSLYSRDQFTSKVVNERMFLGLFYGILIAIILYNLFHYFSTRHAYFLYYVLYSFFFGLITGTYDGLTPEFLHFYVRWTGGYHDIFSIGLANIFFMAFMLSFLQLRKIAPRFRLMVYVYIFITMIIFLMTIWAPAIAFISAAFLSFPTAFVVIYGGLKARKSKLRESSFFLFGYLVFFIFIFIAVLTIIKVLPTNFFTFHALHFGYFSNLLILSAGLGYKLDFGMKERQKLIEEKNRELEHKVLVRTKEISDQNEELLKLNSEMDRFVYSTSHDLKAPLSSLLGLIKIMRMEDDPSQVKGYFTMMEKTILKLSNFINEIVDYSRNTRMEVESNEIDFDGLINEVFESLEFIEESKLVQREVSVNSNGKFYTDRNRLKVIMNNLISNALRFAGVGIELKEVKVSVDISHEEASICVEDTGPGIKEEHLDKIFDMFYRASNTKSGSGLGLYIVKETLNKLEGQIEVESKVNEGTRFTFKIPNLIPN